jgi:hypothetical protein
MALNFAPASSAAGIALRIDRAIGLRTMRTRADLTETPVRKHRVRGRPFEKGVSGNPGGRPKGDATVKELARAHTGEAIETLVSMLQAESERTRVAAAEALLSRGWGTPTAHVETGPPGSFAEALDAVKLRAQSDN